MGTIKQGILGGFSGKVGTVIGSSWKGISYMKGRAQSTRNPKTAAQTMQRTYFKQLAALIAQLSDEQIHALFPHSVKGKTPRNILMQQLDACAVIDEDVKSVDLSLLEGIGNGEKINSPMLSCEVNSIGMPGSEILAILIDFQDLRAIEKPANANFIVVAYNVTKGTLGIFNTPYTGTDVNIDIDVKGWAEEGDQVRFYLTYASSGEDVSMRGFGSFIIKTRAEKKRRNITKNEPDKGSGDDGDKIYSINPVVPRNDERPVMNNDGDGSGDDGDGDGGSPAPSFSDNGLDS